MNVLQICNYQYPHIGGIEQVGRDLIGALKSCEDVNQMMICFNEDANDGEYVCHRKETVHDYVDGIEVIRCGCQVKIASQSLSITYPRELKKVLKEFCPDLIIFHYPNPYVAYFLLKQISNKTQLIVYWHLDIVKQKILGKLFHFQSLKLCERANKIVATSPNYIDGSIYLSKFKEKCVVIPNSIDIKRLTIDDDVLQETSNIRCKFSNKIICFAVGRHVQYKGLKYLINAARFIPDNYVIVLGGEGKLTAKLKKQAHDLNNVVFVGRLNNTKLIAFYNACDIFCFPSITKNEAFGIALAEAMYLKKPAITFNINGSGVNYVNLDQLTGIEVPNKDVLKYASAITKLGTDCELRNQLGTNAQNRVVNLFTYDCFKKSIKKLICSLEM